MRRKEREMTKEDALRCFDNSPYMVVSCMDEKGKPYSVPLSGIRIQKQIYFHCAMQGRKTELFKENAPVCVNAVSYIEKATKQFTVYYASVIINGHIHLVEDQECKRMVLRKLTETYTPEMLSALEGELQKLSHTSIYRIEIESISGKGNYEK